MNCSPTLITQRFDAGSAYPLSRIGRPRGGASEPLAKCHDRIPIRDRCRFKSNSYDADGHWNGGDPFLGLAGDLLSITRALSSSVSGVTASGAFAGRKT